MKYLMYALLVLSMYCPFTVLSQEDQIEFDITVSFDTAYPDNVTLAMNCSHAIPGSQTVTFNPVDILVLFVTPMSEEMTCEIYQTIPTDGFTTTYSANGADSSPYYCDFGVENLLANNSCLVTNIAWPVDTLEIPGGIFGYERVRQYGFIPGNVERIVEAKCASGKMVLGGGYLHLSGGAAEIRNFGPSPDGQGYYLQMSSLSPEPQEVEVTAICAGVPKKPHFED